MSALEDLAARLGIEPEFRDARGQPRHVAADVQASLLRAMGVSAGTEAEASQALDAVEREDWQSVLPPVVVVRGNAEPVVIDIVLPAGHGRISWLLQLEDGTRRTGEAEPASLPLTDTRALDGRQLERRRLAIAGELPHGYHRLSLDGHEARTTLIVAPEKCWLPEGIGRGQRYWGVSTQLYLLKSAGNWGIGDFSDLRRLVGMVSDAGADIVGLNPLHAMFLDDPEHASPYSPATRLLLNVLNIDVTGVPELAGCPPARELVASADFQRRRSPAAPAVGTASLCRGRRPQA